MSISPNAGPGRRQDGDSDVYTVLLIVAFLSLLLSTVYVGYRATTMLGGLLPPGGL